MRGRDIAQEVRHDWKDDADSDGVDHRSGEDENEIETVLHGVPGGQGNVPGEERLVGRAAEGKRHQTVPVIRESRTARISGIAKKGE